jgi:hypothetical protein
MHYHVGGMEEERVRRAPFPGTRQAGALVPRRSLRTALLVSLLAQGLLVRMWGLRFGLPNTDCRPDETVIVELATQFWSGDLDPHFFRYPTLDIYLTSMAFAADYLQGRVRGTYSSVSAFRERLLEDGPRFYLLARGLTALLGTATILVLYRLASAVAGHATGLVAAFFLSLTYLHARDSHFATTDVPLTFFLTLAVLFVWRSYARGRTTDYAWAGLLAGLAMATKYVGLLMVVPLGIAHLTRSRPPSESPLAPAKTRKLAVFGLGLALGFVVGAPFAVPEWRQLLRDVLTEWDYAGRGYWEVFGRGWSFHPRFSLWEGLGAPQFLAGVAGLVLFAVRRPRDAAVLLGFPIAYCGLIARSQAVFVRYTIPLLPFLCIGAAWLVTFLCARLAGGWRAPRAGALVPLVALATVAPSAANLLMVDRLLARTDTRLLTRPWIESQVAPGESLFKSGARWGTVQLPLSEGAITNRYRGERRLETRRFLLREARRRGNVGYDDWAMDGTRFTRNGRATADLPRFILVQRSPLVVYSAVPEELNELLKARYVLRQSFLYNVWDPRAVFDQQDAFYLPFAGVRTVAFPGPNFELYERQPGGS